MKAVELQQQGQLHASEKICLDVLKQDPNNPDAMHLLGLAKYLQGKTQEAISLITEAVQAQPRNPLFHANLGECLRQTGDYSRAESHYRKALQHDPRFTNALNGLAICLGEQGHHDHATQTLKKLLRYEPDNGHAHTNLARSLRELGRHDEALRHGMKALQLSPDNPAVYNNVGLILSNVGRHDEAIRHYQKAIHLDQEFGHAYYNLAQAKKFSADDDDLIRFMEKSLKISGLDRQSQIQLHFALGKAHDDRKAWEKAFRHYDQANKMSGIHFDASSFRRYIDDIITTFDSSFFASCNITGNTKARPIFIVGMPRSGTTLLEQILASHPDLHGIGECTEIPRITLKMQEYLQASSPYPACMTKITEKKVRKLATSYLKAVRLSKQTTVSSIDKMPTNFLHLGLILLLFPDARILHMTRHPLDTCLSCYFQHFSNRNNYTYDLVSLGQYYREYLRIMKHWKRLMPDRILDIAYESLVADQGNETQRILEYCELDWNESCLDFHKTQRAVQTASNFQIRQPIYTTSRARWKNYSKHLTPLARALGDDLPPDAVDTFSGDVLADDVKQPPSGISRLLGRIWRR